jgi:hypothetical protein
MRLSRKSLTRRHYAFMLFVLVLVIHTPVDHFIPIFPSFVFPAFDASPKLKNTVTIGFFELYGETESKKMVHLSKKNFFNGLYEKHINFFLNAVVKKEQSADGKKISDPQRRAFLAYCKAQFRRIYPKERFSKLVILRVSKLYNIKTNQLEPKTVVDKKCAISLI